MGYCMTQRGCFFIIPKDKHQDCLGAIKKLAKKLPEAGTGGYHGGKSCYAWVDTDAFVNAKTLQEALIAWRWNPDWTTDDDKRDIVDIYFEGDKLGDDLILLESIAPFVKENSYIEMSGEDGSIWRWVFEKGTCLEIPATITF